MSKHPIRVLLVEDDRLAQKASVIVLQELNCEVDIAENGAKALEFVDRKKYDLIFMDLGLPDLDGFVVTQTIQNFKRHYRKIPIIALTAHIEEVYRRKGFEAGLTDFLVKPLTEERSRAMLDQYLAKRL